ncbi:amidohydrolase family protein [Roseibium sp.]|uniref:amidohydrolase family protein n=1 Tax=Roseibium sp. TaxID=1936156 RepID=UPI003299D6DA
MPFGACDCHAHVFNAASQLVPNRVYTPPDASLESYRHVLQTLGLSRGVIVQPSVYGTDNLATLAAVAEGGENYRAVVVVNEDVELHELQDLHAKGARGARVNALFQSDACLNDVQRLARTLSDATWHLQLLTDVSTIEDLEGFIRGLPVPVVFDHFGHIPAHLDTNHPGFRALLKLVGEGLAWVKLSGSYRLSAEDRPPYSDVTPFAHALISANPDQLVWASDWPHPHIRPPMPNDGALLDMLAEWAPSDAIRTQILVENPARLYGFDLPKPQE